MEYSMAASPPLFDTRLFARQNAGALPTISCAAQLAIAWRDAASRSPCRSSSRRRTPDGWVRGTRRSTGSRRAPGARGQPRGRSRRMRRYPRTPGRSRTHRNVAEERKAAQDEPAIDEAERPHEDRVGARRREVASRVGRDAAAGDRVDGSHGMEDADARRAVGDTLDYVVPMTYAEVHSSRAHSGGGRG